MMKKSIELTIKVASDIVTAMVTVFTLLGVEIMPN